MKVEQSDQFKLFSFVAEIKYPDSDLRKNAVNEMAIEFSQELLNRCDACVIAEMIATNHMTAVGIGGVTYGRLAAIEHVSKFIKTEGLFFDVPWPLKVQFVIPELGDESLKLCSLLVSVWRHFDDGRLSPEQKTAAVRWFVDWLKPFSGGCEIPF